jgi:hypothetical protein
MKHIQIFIDEIKTDVPAHKSICDLEAWIEDAQALIDIIPSLNRQLQVSDSGYALRRDMDCVFSELSDLINQCNARIEEIKENTYGNCPEDDAYEQYRSAKIDEQAGA